MIRNNQNCHENNLNEVALSLFLKLQSSQCSKAGQEICEMVERIKFNAFTIWFSDTILPLTSRDALSWLSWLVWFWSCIGGCTVLLKPVNWFCAMGLFPFRLIWSLRVSWMISCVLPSTIVRPSCKERQEIALKNTMNYILTNPGNKFQWLLTGVSVENLLLWSMNLQFIAYRTYIDRQMDIK